MEIIKQPQTIITGRLSDGSDRQEKTVWNVTVKDSGKTYFKIYDTDPEEISIEEMEDITTAESVEMQEIKDNILTLAQKVLELGGVL